MENRKTRSQEPRDIFYSHIALIFPRHSSRTKRENHETARERESKGHALTVADKCYISDVTASVADDDLCSWNMQIFVSAFSQQKREAKINISVM